ncbi:hypothetical protein Tco_1228166 [Tanacetum coccineum]
MLAETSILTVMQTLEEKQNDTENMQELLLQLSKDLQTLGNTLNQLKQEEQDSSQYWKPAQTRLFKSRPHPDYTSPTQTIHPTSITHPYTILTINRPDLPITDSLVMEDEHLDTILETDSDEEIESSVENLNLTPSESEDLSDYVSECDLPFCDISPDFNKDSKIFSNPLFDFNADYTSSDDKSSSEEDVPSSPVDLALNHPIPPSDQFQNPFHVKFAVSIPSSNRIAETNFDPKEDICLIKKLLYDNSSPLPPEELNSENDFSGSTTIHTDISLLEYESFDDESDSASEIFNDDLAHITSPSEYEYVYADDESDSRDLTTDVNLNLTPSESEDLSDYVSECDLPFCDNSQDFNKDSKIFSNPLFDSNADYTSSDDESSSEEDVPVENFKIYSNPLLEFDEEIFSKSLLNKDTVITSPKIDFLFEEFADELALINPIPPGIAETNFDPKKDIHLIKKLLYDNSSLLLPEELDSDNDFSGRTTIHTNISLPKYESFDDESDSASEIFNDDLAHIISPSEYEYVYADDESDSGDLTTDVVEDILGDSTRKIQMSYQGFKTLKISHNFFNNSPMMIYGEDMPILDVPYLHFYPP